MDAFASLFGSGLEGKIIAGAIGLACALVMSFAGGGSVIYRIAALIGPAMDLVSGLAGKGSSPVLSTSSSALHTGSAPTSPAVPVGPVVLQGPPPVDQEGLP